MFRVISLIITTTLITIIVSLGLLTYYVWVKNPLNIRTCLVTNFLNATSTKAVVTDDKSDGTSTKSSNPLISDQQAGMLEKAGINVESLPTAISPELEACFVEKLGAERVKEIKAGDIPGPIELYKAKGCL